MQRKNQDEERKHMKTKTMTRKKTGKGGKILVKARPKQTWPTTLFKYSFRLKGIATE